MLKTLALGLCHADFTLSMAVAADNPFNGSCFSIHRCCPAAGVEVILSG